MQHIFASEEEYTGKCRIVCMYSF